jgi:hypothetical protein
LQRSWAPAKAGEKAKAVTNVAATSFVNMELLLSQVDDVRYWLNAGRR